MPNASNTSSVTSVLRGSRHDRRPGVLAVQGPHARDRLAPLAPEAAAVGRFRVAATRVGRRADRVAGTGYTGEDGVECAVPAEAAPAFWRRSSAPASVPPASGRATRCGSRPALPLHGHELGPGITPLQAGLGWVVGLGEGGLPWARRPSRPSGPPGCAGVLLRASPPTAASHPGTAPR